MSEENVHFMSENTERETPQWLFDRLNQIFAFEIDLAANESTAKCPKYYSEEDDSLQQEWKGCGWLNPPYGRSIGKWIKKAVKSAKGECTVVCLTAARTDTNWFQYCWSHAKYIVFIKGRLRFGPLTENGQGNVAPFPSAIIIFGDEEELPPDRELTFLAELGTVVRPVWKYAPCSAPDEEYRASVPFTGTIMDYRRARGELPSAEEKEMEDVYSPNSKPEDSSAPRDTEISEDEEERTGPHHIYFREF